MLRDKYHGQRCAYCPRLMQRGDARLMPTRDHVIPLSRGGRTKVICCQTCNGIKADMLPDEWTAFMEANPGWWKLSRVELRLVRRHARGLSTVPRRRGLRHVERQGTAPMPPVVVPPELIFTEGT